ncbi:MAG: hypothetical protein JXD18_12670 [Anaerolineae bacterium]|nr:hypothetical protein [Anaerolineae bacterium]
MGQRRTGRWALLSTAGGGALVFLLLAVVLIAGRGMETDATPELLPPVSTLPTAPAATPVVATVNGQPIARDVWLEAVLVDQVMSRVAGVAVPEPTETLDVLILEQIVLQSTASAPTTPAAADVEQYIASLEAAWGISDDSLVSLMAEVGLERAALNRVVTRMLTMQAAQWTIDTGGTPLNEWLYRQRDAADVVIYSEATSIDGLARLGQALDERLRLQTSSPLPTPAFTSPVSPILTPSSRPLIVANVPAIAPDFSLPRGDGGRLTLSQQLAEGPVVLVFFQKCG